MSRNDISTPYLKKEEDEYRFSNAVKFAFEYSKPICLKYFGQKIEEKAEIN